MKIRYSNLKFDEPTGYYRNPYSYALVPRSEILATDDPSVHVRVVDDGTDLEGVYDRGRVRFASPRVLRIGVSASSGVRYREFTLMDKQGEVAVTVPDPEIAAWGVEAVEIEERFVLSELWGRAFEDFNLVEEPLPDGLRAVVRRSQTPKCVACGQPMSPESKGTVGYHCDNPTCQVNTGTPGAEVGVKHDGGKPRWDLLPWAAAEEVVKVLTHAVESGEYPEDNWRNVPGLKRRYFAAAVRHFRARMRGEVLDSKTKLPHLAHIGCCVLFILEDEIMETLGKPKQREPWFEAPQSEAPEE